jgi:Tol biopolymer transport system component
MALAGLRNPMLAALALSLPLLFLHTRSAAAAWPGRNGPIVFAGGDAQSGNGLWAKQPGSKGMRHLTRDRSDSAPQTSPDGRSIVFTRLVKEPLPVGGVFRALHVFLARGDGTGVREVTTGRIFDRFPSFSRSGSRILFSRFEPGAEDADIFTVRLDGSGLHRLTSGPGDDRNPVFSPNGRLIAFDRFLSGHTRHVYTMRPDGSRVFDATPNLAAWSSEPDFNPAGNQIVFVRGFPGDRRADLFTMRPDGAKRLRLTGMPNRPAGFFSNPVYSPDGRLVVAQREREGQFSKLQLIRVRNGSFGTTFGGRRMARSPDVRDPAWMVR